MVTCGARVVVTLRTKKKMVYMDRVLEKNN